MKIDLRNYYINIDEDFDTQIIRTEYDKAANLITTLHGGDRYKLADSMWYAFNEATPDETINYEKFSTNFFNLSLGVE